MRAAISRREEVGRLWAAISSRQEVGRLWAWSGPENLGLITVAAYGIAFLIAEIMIAYVNLIAGAALHAIILITAVQHGILWERSRSWRRHGLYGDMMTFLLCWPLADLTRLAGIGLPLDHLALEIRPGIVALVLEVGVVSVLRASALSWEDLGLWHPEARPELLMGAAGLPLGLIAFMLTSRSNLGQTRGVVAIVVSAALVACVGAAEEMIFRGLLQKACVGILGWVGVPFTAVLSAAPLLSDRSLGVFLYGFLVALLFGLWVYRRRNLMGVVIAHGVLAATMSVIWPHLL